MDSIDLRFNNLRQKLDILGYGESLPLSAVPLVGRLFEDLVKTTESLRDAKLDIAKYLEEKTCWDLGVEPYKCDNSRLLSQCNSLHIELIKQKDEFDEKICDHRQKIRNLETDKRHLENHCLELENNVRDLLQRVTGTSKNKKNDVNMSKKPFVSTVKTGAYVPNPPKSETSSAYRCAKCSIVVMSKHSDGRTQEIHLQNALQKHLDHAATLKDKIESRDREIHRLNNLLSGGRPAEALAKDCCYKNVGTLSEDVEILQKEKVEIFKKYRDSQDSMHEAMKRAMTLEEKNKELAKELEDLEKVALNFEKEANADISKRENEFLELRKELEKTKTQELNNRGRSLDEKKLHEKMNALTQREKELLDVIDKITKKNAKLKNKLGALHKDNASKDHSQGQLTMKDEEILRYKAERDFFQREYLTMVEKSVSNVEAEMLKSQLELKSNELQILTKELNEIRYQFTTINIPEESRSTSSHSVQAAIIRAERERDVVRDEMNCIRIERDCLRGKLECAIESQMSERRRIDEENQQLRTKICQLEKDKCEMIAIHLPERTHLTLIKEEMEELKRRVQDLQNENHKLSTTNNQLRILQDQTEKALICHQNKLVAAETNLENAECRLSAVGTSRESARNELGLLRNENSVLKSDNASLECEKDGLIMELDKKTEKICQLEAETKMLQKQKEDYHGKVKSLERKLGETTNQKQDRENELHETSTETKTLRQQVCNLKAIRDQAMAENSRITNELADVASDLSLAKSKLKDSGKEIDRLKQQLQEYVQEVQRAENLLILKEQEREEMLEHYRSLSHDAVLLEGNNHSLEIETAEQKRQISDAELELSNLKKELAAKEDCISKLEKQVTCLSRQVCELQTELEQNYDEQRLLKVDLDATKELTEKLDLQRDKLNAEVGEIKNIKSQIERENKDLREKLMSIDSKDKAAKGSLELLLGTCRNELELQRKTTAELSQEIVKLRQKICELEASLSNEREKSHRSELTAKEYSVKIQELRQKLTNDRFQLARSREVSPSSTTFNSPRDSIGSKFSNRRYISSSKSIAKNLSLDKKKALDKDIKSFLKSVKTSQESSHEYKEKVSMDEDSSDIIIRRKKTTTSRVVNAKHASPSSKSSKTSKYRSTPNSKSGLTIVSQSLSPRTFSQYDGKSKEGYMSKSKMRKTEQSTSDPEIDYSKSLQMKTDHRFTGNLDFTTAVKLKISPRKKYQKDTGADVKNTKVEVIPSNATVEFLSADLISNQTAASEVEKFKLDLADLDSHDSDTGKTTSTFRKLQIKIPAKDYKCSQSIYPLSSATDTTTTFPTTSVSIIPEYQPLVKIETTTNNPTNYHSISANSSRANQNRKFRKKSSTLAQETSIKPFTPSQPEHFNGCACMKNKKLQILANCNMSPNGNNAGPQNTYYRKSTLIQNTAGKEGTESSSGVEGTLPKRRSIRFRTKKFDISKLPPPPSFYQKKM